MKKGRLFFRSFYISFVVLTCLVFGFFAMARAYETTVLLESGEYKKAVEISDGSLRIFDFEINFEE